MMERFFRRLKQIVVRVAFLYALLVALLCKVASIWLNGMVSLDENPVADAKCRLAASVLLKSQPRSNWLSSANQSAKSTAEPVVTPWFGLCPKTESQSTIQRRERLLSEPSTMLSKTNLTLTMFDVTFWSKAQSSKPTKGVFELLLVLEKTVLSTAFFLTEIVPQGSSHSRPSEQMVN